MPVDLERKRAGMRTYYWQNRDVIFARAVAWNKANKKRIKFLKQRRKERALKCS